MKSRLVFVRKTENVNLRGMKIIKILVLHMESWCVAFALQEVYIYSFSDVMSHFCFGDGKIVITHILPVENLF